MIERDQQGNVFVLRLAHGKANALDTELLREIPVALREAADSDARACILTNSGNIFCAGVDLKQLAGGGDAYLAGFMPALIGAFRSLFFFPKPLIGAARGHAIAGGCVALQCCDVRIGVHGDGRIGIPELAVGVPFPAMALEVMRFVLPPHHLQDVVYSGKAYGVEQGLARGLFDRLVDDDALEEEALAAARRLGGYPQESFAFTKRQLRRGVAEKLAAISPDEDEQVRELWASDPVRHAVAEYVAKVLG